MPTVVRLKLKKILHRNWGITIEYSNGVLSPRAVVSPLGAMAPWWLTDGDGEQLAALAFYIFAQVQLIQTNFKN